MNSANNSKCYSLQQHSEFSELFCCKLELKFNVLICVCYTYTAMHAVRCYCAGFARGPRICWLVPGRCSCRMTITSPGQGVCRMVSVVKGCIL
jgi:hypothetical protein